MNDYSIIVCKNCGQTKRRIRAGTYPNIKDCRWVDENGKQFSGHLCPECVVEKARLRKQLKKRTRK